MAFLELHHLHVYFNTGTGMFGKGAKSTIHAVNDVSLHVRQGEILGLVGESGCGKSTLSRTIMQLQQPTSGHIILAGTELTALPPNEIRKRRPDFQMVFQDPYASLNPRFTVFATLKEALLCRSATTDTDDIKDRVARLMYKVGLSPDLMFKYPHEFSGGQRQRIAIARALAPKPRLIIADEPVSALDVSIQSQILNLLVSLTREMNLTMIFISHDLSVVYYLADSIAVMRQGQIVEYGTAEQVYKTPQHPYTKELLAAVPHIKI